MQMVNTFALLLLARTGGEKNVCLQWLEDWRMPRCFRTIEAGLGRAGLKVITRIIIHVVLSGVLIGRETITSLQITAYE